jgi:hypothetical protein
MNHHESTVLMLITINFNHWPRTQTGHFKNTPTTDKHSANNTLALHAGCCNHFHTLTTEAQANLQQCMIPMYDTKVWGLYCDVCAILQAEVRYA